jgi:hypothetical protein
MRWPLRPGIINLAYYSTCNLLHKQETYVHTTLKVQNFANRLEMIFPDEEMRFFHGCQIYLDAMYQNVPKLG